MKVFLLRSVRDDATKNPLILENYGTFPKSYIAPLPEPKNHNNNKAIKWEMKIFVIENFNVGVENCKYIDISYSLPIDAVRYLLFSLMENTSLCTVGSSW